MVGQKSDPVKLYDTHDTSDELNIGGLKGRRAIAPKLLEGLEPRYLKKFTPMYVASMLRRDKDYFRLSRSLLEQKIERLGLVKFW